MNLTREQMMALDDRRIHAEMDGKPPCVCGGAWVGHFSARYMRQCGRDVQLSGAGCSHCDACPGYRVAA